MSGEDRHPILADTSSLIAVANTPHWETFATSVGVTTTNVCKQELNQHVRSHSHAPEGSREHYLKQGSRRVLDKLEAPEAPVTWVTVVPRPHGADAGEQSIEQEVKAHPDAYEVVTLLDMPARRSLRRLIETRGYDIDVVGPPYLLYVLLDTDLITREKFCEATAVMLRTEGWTGYETVKAAWTSIPVDCREILDDEFDDVLPP